MPIPILGFSAKYWHIDNLFRAALLKAEYHKGSCETSVKRLPNVTKIPIKMYPLSTDGAILIIVFLLKAALTNLTEFLLIADTNTDIMKNVPIVETRAVVATDTSLSTVGPSGSRQSRLSRPGGPYRLKVFLYH